MTALRVSVLASDPLTGTGVASALQAQGVVVTDVADSTDVDVRVVAVDVVTGPLIATMRRTSRAAKVPVVLVVGEMCEQELLAAIECRVVAVLFRTMASGEQLVRAVRAAAAGGGVLPPAMLGELLAQVERLQRELVVPKGTGAGLTSREVDVLRLIADGRDTAEIAGVLCYSERTVKNVIAGITHRLKLRNRPHAVAYALRCGVI